MMRNMTAVVVGLFSTGMIAFAPRAQAGGISDTGSWARVSHLEPGRTLTVLVRGAAPASYRMAFADSLHLVVLRFPGRHLPKPVVDVMKQADWPSVLAGTRNYGWESVVVSRDGVFHGGARIADLLTLGRDEILEITTEGVKRSPLYGVVGGLIGAAVGVPTFLGLSYARCPGGNCAASYQQGKALLALFGLPVAGALVGYYGFSPGSEPDVVYRARLAAGLPIDDAMWQRVRRALPPSLRGVR